WAEHFDVDLGDVLEVQGGIARRVSEALEVKLLRGEEEALRTVERGGSEAHVAYLKGRHLLQKSTREALDTAIGYFEEAFARDPEHARALAGLADAYCMMVSFTSAEESYPRARRYAEQAIALDGSLAEAHNSLAGIALGYEGKPGKAERLMRRAIQLDPNCALAHTNLGILLAQADRTDEAIEAVRVALALDPLSPPLIAAYAECLYTAARFHEAIEQAKKALELDPEEPCADWVFWYSLAATWDWDRAEEVLRQNVARYPENPLVYLNLAACVMCRGRLQEGIVEVEKALALPGATEQIRVLTLAGSHYYFARNYDRALALLNEALERIPTNRLARIARSLTYLMLGRHGDCLEDLEEAERIVEGADVFWSAYVHMNRGRVYALLGQVEKAERELQVLNEAVGRQNRRIGMAGILVALGRIEECLDRLEEAADAHEPHVVTIRKTPTIPDELWEHPRFIAFLKRVGLADDLKRGRA
ncbi:tetratricopeptide repeat protein, partial [Candidatus Bipolaricaulota bacterium]